VNRYQRGIAAALLIVPLALVFHACSSDQSDVVNPTGGISNPGAGTSHVTFGDFTVTYTGRSYNGTNTTFSYNVSGPARDMHFRVGWPVTQCTAAPVSWIPSNGATGNNDCCINPGLEWHPAVGPGPNSSFDCSFTFAGDIPEGTIPASVKSNSTVVVGEIAGPGVPMYTISGTVFQDANASGALDAGETIISGVTISLLQSGSLLSSTTSDGSGSYAFVVPCGTYTVQLDTLTLTGTQKNYFEATTALAYTRTVGPDSPGNNYGFEVNSDKAIQDLGNGTLPTTGAKADFWKKEYQFGSQGKNGYFPRDSMIVFLNRLEDVALETPFVFTGTDAVRLDAVYQILRKPIRTDFEALERQLLTVELNYVAGFGIDPSTQLVMIGWGETLYNDALSGANPKNGVTMGTLTGATSLYEGINANKSPGGGGSTR